MEIRYRIYDKKTLKDITDDFNWVIMPDGSLYVSTTFGGQLVCVQDAFYEVAIKNGSTWEKVYDGYDNT